jgi:RNA polymerase sigma factor (sigma-70 family)
MAGRQLNTVMQHIRRLALPPGCRLSDRELLERFISRRDEGAFAALVQRHGPMVLGLCRRVLRHDQDAEDACQAAFLVLARKAGSIRNRDCAGSWLHGVAYRIARNLSREIARRRARESPAKEISQADPAGDLSWREVRAALDQVIDGMPERYRAPLVLCYLEGKTRDEAAQHLGWSLGTLRGRLERGRELLRSRLVRRGLTLGTALLGSSLAPQATAALPSNLVIATVQAAKWTLTNPALPSSLVSAQVAVLTKGALKTMTLTKVKIAAGFLVALSALGGGAGALTLGTLADEPGQAQKKESPAPPKTEKAEASRERQRPEKAANTKPASGFVTATLNASAAVLTVTFSPDGKVLATGGSDGNVRLWDVRTGKVLMSFGTKHSAAIHAVMFSPDGKTLAAAGDAKGKIDGPSLRVWNVATAEEQANFRGHLAPVWSVAYTPDGKRLASTGDDSAVRLWDVASGNELWTYQVEGGRSRSIAFTPDGRDLWAADQYRNLRLLEAATGKELRRIALSTPDELSSPAHRAVVISPDGKLLATAARNDSAVSLWEAASGKELRRFLTHDKGVMSVAFSPDGSLLASAGEDRTARLWDLATRREVAVLKGHKDTVNSMAFSPDGSLLATGSSDKSVKLWVLTVKLWDSKAGRAAQHVAVTGAALANDPLEHLLDDLVKKQKNDQESVDALYLATLARFPSETEMKFAQESLAKKEDRRRALGDLLFALTNTKEFTTHLESLGTRHPPRQH